MNRAKFLKIGISAIFGISAVAFSCLVQRYPSLLSLGLSAFVSFVGAFFIGYFRIEKRVFKKPLILPLVFALILAVCSIWGLFGYASWSPRVNLLGAVGAVPFLFGSYYEIIATLFENKAFGIFTKHDRIVFPSLLLLLFVFVVVIFDQTFVFSMGEYKSYDILYTSDSGAIFHENSFLNPLSMENDIRQPYFFLTALPFASVAKVVSIALPFPYSYAVTLEWAQAFVILVLGYVLADLIDLKGVLRYGFLALWLSTYTQLFFLLLIEQYVFGTFFLILSAYLIKKGNVFAVPVCALSVGGLITNLAVAPAAVIPQKKSVKEWLIRMGVGVSFLVWFLCLGGQLNQILDRDTLTATIEMLGSFSGTELTLADKLMQYSHHVANLFLPAQAEAKFVGAFVYQLLPISTFRIEGILLFILAIVCFAFNYKEKAAWLTGYWVLFSFLLLGVAGYGTSENGLILYSFYTCWAFLCLYALGLKKLVTLLPKGQNVVFLSVSGGLAVLLLISSYLSFAPLLAFAAHYYPGYI